MMAMIANISTLTLTAINLAVPLCKFLKLATNSAAASVAYKSTMSLLATVAFYLAMLVTWAASVIATAKSKKAAFTLAKIAKIGVLVKVMSTIVVTHASALEA